MLSFQNTIICLYLYVFMLHTFQDDTILQNFLNGCKNNAEIAKIKLDNFYSRRHDYPEFFSNRDPRNEEIKRSVSSLLVFF